MKPIVLPPKGDILVVTDQCGNDSGWDRYSTDMVKALRAQGKRVVVAARSGPRNADIKLPNPLQFKKLALVSFWSALFFFLRNRGKLSNIGYIHCFMEPYAPFTRYLALLLSKPYFLTMHGSYAVRTLEGWALSRMQAKSYRNARSIICVSQYTKNILSKRITVSNLEVISNGVDTDKFPATNHSFEEKVLIGVGALKKRKAFHFVLSAMPDILKEFPNTHYYIVGSTEDSKYVRTLEEQIKSLKLEKSVTITGTVSEERLHELYQKASVFVLTPDSSTSSFEGFGLVYLEANSVGLPVVGMKGSGAQEAIQDGESGFLIEARNIKQLGEKISLLLRDKTLWESMSEKGIQWAKQNDWKNVITKYLTIYN